MKNGQIIQLAAPPYIRNNRVMVPLRFISNALGLGVDYHDACINMISPTLKIQDTPISTIQSHSRMTMGSVVSESKTNNCINRLYNAFEGHKVQSIEQPKSFGSHNDLDALDYYYELKDDQFKDDFNSVIAQYKIYAHQSYGNSKGLYAIQDVIHNKWYFCTEEDYLSILDLEYLGEWIEVSNTVV